MVRVPDCRSGCCGFESRRPRKRPCGNLFPQGLLFEMAVRTRDIMILSRSPTGIIPVLENLETRASRFFYRTYDKYVILIIFQLIVSKFPKIIGRPIWLIENIKILN